jgi:hypothetical protein
MSHALAAALLLLRPYWVCGTMDTRIAIRANNNRSQPRHDQRAWANHRHPFRVQGEAPARWKVPETCRNGFWRNAPTTRSGINRTERFLAKRAHHAQWHQQNGTVSGETRLPRAVASTEWNGFWRT